MQYGICCNPELTESVRKAGFDFFEWNVAAFLKPRESDEAFAATLALVQKAALPCPVVNCFIPSDLKITGPVVDIKTLEQFVQVACARARVAGVDTIVFGSGGARRVPEGFERNKARQQIADFCRMLAPVAGAHGITIVLEPLYHKACNVLNKVSECAELVREVNHPAFRLLVDSFHFLYDHDALEDIIANGPLLAHVHIATVPCRLPPGAEKCDLLPFFEALIRGGYNRRIAIESDLPKGETILPNAVSYMKACEKLARQKQTKTAGL